jgi:hypothetical protein
MNTETKHDEIRLAVVRLLEKKGYGVVNAASGSGIPKFSRIIIEKGDERLDCVIKTTTGGRISFTRAEDGTYLVLRDADRVIHARRSPVDPSKVHATMFDKATVVEAFEANHNAKIDRGMEHIPSWVNPAPEAGWRRTGSGFQSKALWSETVALSPTGDVTTISSVREHGIMERVKAILAEHMGVRPELIEIDVRVKL